MKSMKKIRSGLIGLGLVIPVASVAGVVASCGKKETPSAKPTFDDFTKAAENETIANIVAQTKPTGWANLPDGELVKGDQEVSGQTVILVISSTKTKQIAIFTATYVADTAYNVSDWICSQNPSNPVSWDDFKKSAESSAQDIFTGIQTANPAGINIDFKSIEATSLVVDASSKFSDDGKNVMLALVLKSVSTTVGFDLTTTINLKIHFHNVAYDAKNWTADPYTFDDFTKAATASVGTTSWQAYAKTQINDGDVDWSNAKCDFGKITADASAKTLTVKVTNTTNFESAIATLKFHSVNNKVWIYGEQMGVDKSGGAWSFAAPVLDKWAKFQSNVKAWAGNSDKVLETVKYFQAHPDSKIPFNATWATAISADDNNVWVAKPTTGKPTNNYVMYYTISLTSSNTDGAKDVSLDISITYTAGADPTFTDSNCKMIKFNVAADPWANNAEAYLLKANTDDVSKDKLLQSIFLLSSSSNNPIIHQFLIDNGDSVNYTWPKLKIVIANLKFVSANPDVDYNKFGQITFTMVFYLKTAPTKALTSGGAFYMNRFSAKSQIKDTGYQTCETKTDIKKL